MSRFKRENQLDMEQILVAYCPSGAADQPFAKGVPLVDASTSLGIADGQLGVLSWDHSPRNGGSYHGNFISAGETPDQVRAIKILQGTPASSNITLADPWEVGHKGYVETGIIYRDNVRSVTIQKCRPKCLANNAVVDLPDPCDNTEYRFFSHMKSSRILTNYGYSGLNVEASFETPCYSALGTVSPKDHYLQNVLFDFNTQSKLFANAFGVDRNGYHDTVALAINTAGGAGVAIGSITCGTVIPFQNDASKSCENPCPTPVSSSVVADLPFVLSLGCMIEKQAQALACGAITDAITAASTIEVIDLSVAGSADNVDAFIVIGLEHEQYRGVDEDPMTLPSVSVNLQAGFRVTPLPGITCCALDEGKGHGRNWVLENDRRFQRTIHNMYVNRDRGSLSLSEGQKYIASNKRYTSIIIDYYDHEENGITLQEQNPKQAIILVCCDYDCDTVANVAENFKTNAEAKSAADRVDLIPTTEVACCPVCDANTPASMLESDLATVLLAWFRDADADFNNGIDFDDFDYKGGPSALFAAAGI